VWLKLARLNLTQVLLAVISDTMTAVSKPTYYVQNLAIKATAFVASTAALFLVVSYLKHGFSFVLLQNMWKSYGSLDNYRKSGLSFESASAVLNSESGSQGFMSQEFPTDKQMPHNYTVYYDRIFQPYVHRDVNVLEVGVKKGGSIKLWRELFTPRSRIYGVDIDPAVPTFVQDPNIKVLIMDSTDRELMTAVLRDEGVEFDIIIDDGDHSENAQEATFHGLAPLLKDTGVYVLEDVHTMDEAVFQLAGFDVRIHAQPACTCEITSCRMAWRCERLMVLYPERSLAARADFGLLDSSPREKPSGRPFAVQKGSPRPKASARMTAELGSSSLSMVADEESQEDLDREEDEVIRAYLQKEALLAGRSNPSNATSIAKSAVRTATRGGLRRGAGDVAAWRRGGGAARRGGAAARDGRGVAGNRRHLVQRLASHAVAAN